MLLIFRVCVIASVLFIQAANTIPIVASPQPSVTIWRGILSIIIITNISAKIITAMICAVITVPLFVYFILIILLIIFFFNPHIFT